MSRSLRSLLTTAATLAAVAVLSASHPEAQADPATQKRIQALEDGQRETQRQVQALQKQIEELKALIQARPAAGGPGAPTLSNVVLPAGGATRGNAKAKITIIEYTDFQCPFCGRYARDTYQTLIREYVDTGKVRYIIRHLPLESIHPHARGAAEAAECARVQGKFWEIHDRLFANQQAIAPADLDRTATSLGLAMPAFKQCLASPATASVVTRDLGEAARVGVSATPSFILGLTQPDGSVRALRGISGAQPYAVFKAALEGLLMGQ